MVHLSKEGCYFIVLRVSREHNDWYSSSVQYAGMSRYRGL